MLALEAGQFVAAQSGLSSDKSTALSLSFLERIKHQEGSNSWSSNKVESDAVQNKLFQNRYGLGLPLEQLMTTSGDPDEFVATTFEAILQKVQTTPGLDALASATPKRATEALIVPDNLVISGSLDKDALQNLATRLGVLGTVDPAEHQWGTWTSPGSRLVINMRDAQNKPFVVSLGLDSEGTARSASKIPVE
jgi:hypothetical protein